MKALVVGAGIVGTSLAHSLLSRGHEVTLIESESIAAGTTSTSYAWINSHKKHPESYHALNYEGLKHWTHVIAHEHPEAVELNGHLELAIDQEHRTTLTQRVHRLQSLDYCAQLITPLEASAVTPIHIPQDALIGYFPGEGHAYPPHLVHARTAAMQQNPAFTLVFDPVVAISRTEGEITLCSGTELQGDLVVLAVGNSTTSLAATAGVHLPMVPRDVGGAAFGYLGYLEAPGHGLRGPVTTDELNLRPDGADRLIVQALDLDLTADPDEAVAPDIGHAFMARLSELLPDQDARLCEVRVGHRVIPGDGLTVAGPASDEADNRLWIAVTHSGVVLGPWLGEAIAEEMTSGEPNPLFTDFRPTRFAGPNPLHQYAPPRRPGDQ